MHRPMDESRLKIVYVATASLKPHPRNPRRHSQEKIAALADHIAEVGWTMPLLVNAKRTILAGHARWMAAQRLGLTQVPAIECKNAEGAKAIVHLIAENQFTLAGEWDADLLRDELQELRLEGTDLSSLGFDAVKLEELFTPIGAPTIEESVFKPVRDRFWISVRGPLGSQAKALKALQAAMADVPGVQVELGTVDAA